MEVPFGTSAVYFITATKNFVTVHNIKRKIAIYKITIVNWPLITLRKSIV